MGTDAKGLAAVSRSELLGYVRVTALIRGWHLSELSATSAPDLMLVRDDAMAFVLVRPPRKVPTASQQHWLAILEATGATTYVWGPADFDSITEALR